MKKELSIVKLALGGPQSTTAEARMLKYQNGRLWSYGGPFCLSTPIASTLECGFFPQLLNSLFEIDRPDLTLTEQGHMLVISSGGKEYKTRRFDATSIPSLIAVGPRHEVTAQLGPVKALADFCRNNVADASQAAWFVDGMIYGLKTRGGVRSGCIAISGLSCPHPPMGVPSDAVAAMARIKSPLVAVTWDKTALQFEFEDGTWLATRLLEGMTAPPFSLMFNSFGNPEQFQPLEFAPGIVDEIRSMKLYGAANDGIPLDMTWVAWQGNLSFLVPKTDDTGSFPQAYTGGADFRIRGENLRTILDLKPHTVGLLRRDQLSPFHSFGGLGDGFAVMGQLNRE